MSHPFDIFGYMDPDPIIREAGLSKELRENIDPEAIEEIQDRVLLIKYGGNAMTDPSLKGALLEDLALLRRLGALPVLVHGGGPAIKRILEEVGVDSEFYGGHRRTSGEAMKYVEMALKGEVNGDLVKGLAEQGVSPVGISGKDGRMVTAVQRYTEEGNEQVDLGHVGDVEKVDPGLIQLLLREKHIPVVAPIAFGPEMKSYNVNADIFAGHLAGALRASTLLMLTDVDGLMRDKEDSTTLIGELPLEELQGLYGNAVQGGMIPKVEACEIALQQGVQSARIVNGTREKVLIRELITRERSGTRILNS